MVPSDPINMLPYLSPNELVPEEEREQEPAYRNWGEYLSSSTNSLDQFAQTSNNKKASKRKSKAPSGKVSQVPNPSEDLSSRSVEPVLPLARKPKSSKAKAITGAAPSVII